MFFYNLFNNMCNFKAVKLSYFLAYIYNQLLFVASSISTFYSKFFGATILRDLGRACRFFSADANKLPHFAVKHLTICVVLPRDARSAKRGIAIVSRLSVPLSVCPSVTLIICGRIGWVSSKVIKRVL